MAFNLSFALWTPQLYAIEQRIAIRFWEKLRLVYNLALTAIVIVYYVVGYPASKSVLSLDFYLTLFLLAVLANVVYCTAYIVDVFAQALAFRDVWFRYRWLLFSIGTIFAAIITRFFAIGMFVRQGQP